MKAKWALKALFIFFAAMIVLTLIARAGDSLMIANVKTSFVMSGALNHETKVDAAVEASDVQMIWAQPGLRVVRIPVAVGTKVAAGDALMQFDPGGITEKAEEAQLALDKLNNERAQLVLEMPDVKTAHAVKLHQLKLAALDMSIEQAKKALSRHRSLLTSGAQLSSPLDGYVTKVAAELGKETTSEAAFHLATMNSGLSMRCEITRDEAKYVTVGDAAEVTPLGRQKSIRAHVSGVMQPDGKGTVEVVVSLPEEDISIGTYCSVKFSRMTEGYPSIVPVSALHGEGVGTYVLVLRGKKSVLGDGDVAEKVPVSVLDKDWKCAAVSGALRDDDRVISGWDKPISPGDRVRVEGT